MWNLFRSWQRLQFGIQITGQVPCDSVRAEIRLRGARPWEPHRSPPTPRCEEGRSSDEDQVRVTLTQGFWLGKHKVTQGEWQSVMGTQPWSGEKHVKEGSRYPARYVSWDDGGVALAIGGVNVCHWLCQCLRAKTGMGWRWDFVELM